MAGPLGGIGAGQQVAFAGSIQQGQNSQIRAQDDREAETNQVQPQGASAAETQNTETNNQDVVQQQLEEFAQGEASNLVANENGQQRGSVLDISV